MHRLQEVYVAFGKHGKPLPRMGTYCRYDVQFSMTFVLCSLSYVLCPEVELDPKVVGLVPGNHYHQVLLWYFVSFLAKVRGKLLVSLNIILRLIAHKRVKRKFNN